MFTSREKLYNEICTRSADGFYHTLCNSKETRLSLKHHGCPLEGAIKRLPLEINFKSFLVDKLVLVKLSCMIHHQTLLAMRPVFLLARERYPARFAGNRCENTVMTWIILSDDWSTSYEVGTVFSLFTCCHLSERRRWRKSLSFFI